jgi:hypothetical protein
VEGENSGKKGAVGLDWGDLNVHPLNANLWLSITSFFAGTLTRDDGSERGRKRKKKKGREQDEKEAEET